ncbi:MAG: MarC family protein [Desulfovibrionales bacterium]|nr:MarC family protein [Desulfovibrionales bacterium]
MLDMNWQAVLEISITLFLIFDPLGNAAVCVPMLGGFTPKQQRTIMFRELVIALGIILLFTFLGDYLLRLLDIHHSTLRIAGGIILLIISMKMVFPQGNGSSSDDLEKDPFIVPIAVPLLAGPSLLAAVMLYAARSQENSSGSVELLTAIFFSWLATAAILLCAPSLTKILGNRGLRATERLMGLILIFMAVQMLEDGIRMFVTSF